MFAKRYKRIKNERKLRLMDIDPFFAKSLVKKRKERKVQEKIRLIFGIS